MIVYAGKQFWNDFNNGDEALFQDANLPRDDNKFKIQAWVQARKNDLRTANSNIAAQAVFYGVKVAGGTTDAYNYSKANMKASYTASDLSEVNSFTAQDGTTYNAATVAEWLKAEINWRPYVNADWDITIWKSGVYAVNCQCTFIAPLYYEIWTAVNYKFYIHLIVNDKMYMWTQGRWCWTIDSYSLFYMWYFNAGDKLNTWFLQTYTWRAFLCQPSISLLRLS